MCHVLKVSKSGFYDWLNRQELSPTLSEVARQQRRELVESIFNENRSIYGYRKVHAELRRRGYTYSLNTILADCKYLGIKSATRKKYRVKTTDSNHSNPIAENVLSRTVFLKQSKAQKPNELYC
jgi:glycosidase